MKRIYYKVVKENRRYYGGCNVTAEVFQHRRDGLKRLGEVKWCTASYKGPESEVYGFLRQLKMVPAREYKQSGGYYEWPMRERKKNPLMIRGL